MPLRENAVLEPDAVDDDEERFSVVQLPDPDGASTMVCVLGPLDIQTAPELAQVLDQVTTPLVMVDVSAVAVLCAAGIAVLADAAAARRAAGGYLQVVAAQPLAVRCLHLLRLGDLLALPPPTSPAVS